MAGDEKAFEAVGRGLSAMGIAPWDEPDPTFWDFHTVPRGHPLDELGLDDVDVHAATVWQLLTYVWNLEGCPIPSTPGKTLFAAQMAGLAPYGVPPDGSVPLDWLGSASSTFYPYGAFDCLRNRPHGWPLNMVPLTDLRGRAETVLLLALDLVASSVSWFDSMPDIWIGDPPRRVKLGSAIADVVRGSPRIRVCLSRTDAEWSGIFLPDHWVIALNVRSLEQGLGHEAPLRNSMPAVWTDGHQADAALSASFGPEENRWYVDDHRLFVPGDARHSCSPSSLRVAASILVHELAHAAAMLCGEALHGLCGCHHGDFGDWPVGGRRDVGEGHWWCDAIAAQFVDANWPADARFGPFPARSASAHTLVELSNYQCQLHSSFRGPTLRLRDVQGVTTGAPVFDPTLTEPSTLDAGFAPHAVSFPCR